MNNCLQISPKNAAVVTAECCMLHNLLIRESPGAYLRRMAAQPVHRMPTNCSVTGAEKTTLLDKPSAITCRVMWTLLGRYRGKTELLMGTYV